jgi:hypothetical protein
MPPFRISEKLLLVLPSNSGDPQVGVSAGVALRPCEGIHYVLNEGELSRDGVGGSLPKQRRVYPKLCSILASLVESFTCSPSNSESISLRFKEKRRCPYATDPARYPTSRNSTWLSISSLAGLWSCTFSESLQCSRNLRRSFELEAGGYGEVTSFPPEIDLPMRAETPPRRRVASAKRYGESLMVQVPSQSGRNEVRFSVRRLLYLPGSVFSRVQTRALF